MISHHGYLFLAIVCFAEAVGLPLPAALALLTAGAVAAYGGLHFYLVFGIALLAMITGDVILYFMGRVSGWALLGHSVPAFGESGNLHSALGGIFLPPRQADAAFCQVHPRHQHHVSAARGQHENAPGDFLQFDTLGAAFYVGAYSLAGYLFSDALRAITRGLRSAGFAAEVVFAIGLAVYLVYRIWFTASTVCSTSFPASRPRSWQKDWPPMPLRTC
jgi:membrane protein DedA with SNARE-associated domain